MNKIFTISNAETMLSAFRHSHVFVSRSGIKNIYFCERAALHVFFFVSSFSCCFSVLLSLASQKSMLRFRLCLWRPRAMIFLTLNTNNSLILRSVDGGPECCLPAAVMTSSVCIAHLSGSFFSSFFFAFHLPDVNVTCTLFSVQRNASRCECDNLRPLHPGARSLSLGRVTAVEVFFVFGGRESSTRGSFDSVLTPAAAPSFE
jgi:hypothetical protein